MVVNVDGNVINLFIKPARQAAMVALEEVTFKRALGAEADINAEAMSPRQVLVARYEDLEEYSITAGELRENIVVRGISKEKFLPGTMLTIGESVKIRLTFHCEPCKRIAHLVHPFSLIEGKRGILGVILEGGTVRIGSTITSVPDKFTALPDKPYERFLQFLQKVPAGKVVNYKLLIKGMGTPESYMRAIPKYLQNAAHENYPVHRVLDSYGCLVPYVLNQAEKLEAEGVRVTVEPRLFDEIAGASVDLSQFLWDDPMLFFQS